MRITEHDNGMWGTITWSGDADGKAALITASRSGATLWVFEYQKSGWFKSDSSYWKTIKKYANKEEAYKDLGING